jgi:hypothetical protein
VPFTLWPVPPSRLKVTYRGCGLVKPVLLGYQVVRLGAPADAVAEGERLLRSFALLEGYALGRFSWSVARVGRSRRWRR